MCGIAGILDARGRPIDRSMLERMCAKLPHRGPDEQGIYVNGQAGLGQCRLSIIDLSSGRQPMSNEDGDIWVTFNGEIYNFQELRRTLLERGHRFATNSDTEVILHGYEEEGADWVKSLRGMFAFGLWDGRKRTLLLARDRVGKKPLFYTWADGHFLFASELQALVEHPAVRRAVDPIALDEYLTYGYIPAPRTIFAGVRKLPPAHYLMVQGNDESTSRLERYWQLAYGPKDRVNENEAAACLLAELEEAVRLRLIADVPVGALLSGGVDSSLVVALMSRLSGRRVSTFSIGFDDQAYNELPYARMVAKRYDTDHHEFIVRPDVVDVLPKLVRHYGEPFADSSAVPSYYVARLTRQHVKVALNGDGGDECFAGYDRYRGGLMADRYRRLPLVVRGLLKGASVLIPDSLPRRNRLRQAKRFLQSAGLPPAERYLRWVSFFTPRDKEGMYTPAFRENLHGQDAEAWLTHRYDALADDGLNALDTMLALDVESYLPYDLLVKMDIATMANSLEARSPFLDHKVMEFAARLPGELKLRGRAHKYLLRKVAEPLLPAEVLSRRKMGFGVPVGDWMRVELKGLVEDLLLSPQARIQEYVRPEAMRELAAAHMKGQDRSFQMWSLLWLEMWHREFLS